MKQRGILFILILMILILVLAGCGGGSNSPGGPGSPGGGRTVSGYLFYDDVSKIVRISDSAASSRIAVGQNRVSNASAADIAVSGGVVALKGTSFSATTGSDGHFVINNVPDGDYEMTVDYHSTIYTGFFVNVGPIILVSYSAIPMKHVQSASFPTGLNDNDTCHDVTRGFYLAETDVTYKQWCTVRDWAEHNGYIFLNEGRKGNDGAAEKTDQHPVTVISWQDAVVWCNAVTDYYNAHGGTAFTFVYKYNGAPIRNAKDDMACGNATVDPAANGFRLPTSMEWELAARYKDGTQWTPGTYASGATAPYTDAAATGAVAWYNENSYQNDPHHDYSTQPVAQKRSNALGLYDMSGNVRQWCNDVPPNGDRGYRVTRGGCHDHGADQLQVGFVSLEALRSGCTDTGFRPARWY